MFKATSDGSVELYHDNSKKFETFSTGVKWDGFLFCDDNSSIRLGNGADLQIIHDGTNSFIKDTGSGSLSISGSQVSLDSSDLSEYMVRAIENNQVELYHNGSKKFQTESFGATLTGNLDVTSGDVKLLTDNKSIQLGADADLTVKHSGSTGVIDNVTGDLHIKTTGSGDELS